MIQKLNEGVKRPFTHHLYEAPLLKKIQIGPNNIAHVRPAPK